MSAYISEKERDGTRDESGERKRNLTRNGTEEQTSDAMPRASVSERLEVSTGAKARCGARKGRRQRSSEKGENCEGRGGASTAESVREKCSMMRRAHLHAAGSISAGLRSMERESDLASRRRSERAAKELEKQGMDNRRGQSAKGAAQRSASQFVQK